MVRRTHGACVTSVLCARVLVCKAQSSERGRGSGEAKLGARHASLRAFLFAQEQNREADILSLRARHRGSRQDLAVPAPWRGRGDGDAGGDAAR